MSYYHVLVSVSGSTRIEVLFADLSLSELRTKFVKPYKRGSTFLAASKVIKPDELRSIRIIESEDKEADARRRINDADLADIAEMNRSGEIMIISPGIGYQPEHLAEAGDDVTSRFLDTGPGAPSTFFGASKKAVGWTLGIVAGALATGLAKWLGWA
jgi:hypothetical protein